VGCLFVVHENSMPSIPLVKYTYIFTCNHHLIGSQAPWLIQASGVTHFLVSSVSYMAIAAPRQRHSYICIPITGKLGLYHRAQEPQQDATRSIQQFTNQRLKMPNCVKVSTYSSRSSSTTLLQILVTTCKGSPHCHYISESPLPIIIGGRDLLSSFHSRLSSIRH
jgi:hypothetical protein